MLPRPFRLLRREDVRSVYEYGRRIGSPNLVLLTRGNKIGSPRVAVHVGRRYGTAVQRNLVKRRIREVVQKELNRMAGMDYIFLPRLPLKTFDAAMLKAFVYRLLEEAGGLKKE